MKLELEELNEVAISFYDRFGFYCQPERALYPSSGIYRHYNVPMVSLNLEHSLSLLENTLEEEDEALPLSFAASAA